MELRIHHFYDIIRSFGMGKKIKPHPYLYSYHKVAGLIKNNPILKIKIVVKCDDICTGCIHLQNGICNDTISHRNDFSSKEEFNNYLDKKILKVCLIKAGDVLTPVQICKKAKLYLENIHWIYLGDDSEHTKTRKENVIKGLKYYSNKHRFSLD